MNSESNDQKPATEFDYSQETVLKMLNQGYMPALVDRLTTIQCQPGDILIFRFMRQLPTQQKDALVANFDAWLARKGLTSIFMPPDLDLCGIVSHPGRKLFAEQMKDKMAEIKAEATKTAVAAAAAKAETPGGQPC